MAIIKPDTNFIESVKKWNFWTPTQWFQEAFIDNWFSQAPNTAINPVTQLQDLWINIQDIDDEVDSEIQESQSNTYTKDIFKDDVYKIMNHNNLDYDSAFDATMKYYQSNWYNIEWIDIYKDLSSGYQETYPTQEVQEDPWFLQKATWSALQSYWSWIIEWAKWVENILSSWLSQAPEIVWNILGFTADVLTPKQYEELWDSLRESWIEDKESIQELLWIDPDAITTGIWEFWAEIASMFLPWGQAKLISKFPQYSESIAKIGTAIWNLSKKSPKSFSTIKSILTWWVEAAKAQVISEWDISATGVVLGGVSLGLIDKLSKISKDPATLLRKITWLKPSQVKKLWLGNIKEDSIIGLQSIIKSKIKPKSQVEVYEALTKRKKEIYEKDFLPIIKKADESGKISIKGLTDDVVKKVSPNLSSGKSTAEVLSGKEDDFSDIVTNLKELESNTITFQDLENLKLTTSAILRESWINGNSKAFMRELDKALWNKLEQTLKLVTWKWAKNLKREYAAISNLQEPLYTKVAKELRDSWTDIVSQFGLFSALQQLSRWEIQAATKTAFVVKILKSLRDPNKSVRQLTNILYGKNIDSLFESVLPPVTWVVSAKWWELLDEF